MASFRFCRTDDTALMAQAIQVGYSPYFLDEQIISESDLMREVREVQVWASSCMLALDGRDPFGILLVARRHHAALVTRLGIHKDYRGYEYGAQMLSSLTEKMAILGPSELQVEVPTAEEGIQEFFQKFGFQKQAGSLMRDYVMPFELSSREMNSAIVEFDCESLEELGPQGLAGELSLGVNKAWIRQLESLKHSSSTVHGLAIAGMDGVEAYLFYTEGRHLPSHGLRPTQVPQPYCEILSLGSRNSPHSEVYYRNLLTRVAEESGCKAFLLPKVSEAEMTSHILHALGFEPHAQYCKLNYKCQ